jgi:hypothetical protein
MDRFKRMYAPLNLSRLQFWIDTGRIDPTKKITMKELIDSGCVGRLRKKQVGIKLLADVLTHISSLFLSFSPRNVHITSHTSHSYLRDETVHFL